MSQQSPFFSIVIPVYNGEAYIEDTLESILQQSYQNFDITLLENCSTDRTVELAQAFNDSRIRIIPSDQFLSIENNWARILDLELPDFLCIFCHDDPMYPGYLAEIVRLIEAEPDATLYHTAFDFVGSELHAKPAPYKETGDEYLFRFHSLQEDSAGSGYVMRFSDYKRVRGFPNVPKLLFADIICWYRLTSLSYKVCSPKICHGYRIHQNSVGAQSGLLEFAQAFQQYFSVLQESGHFENAARRQKASEFANLFFLGRYFSYLNTLIYSDQLDCMADYPQLKAQIMSDLGNYASYIRWDRKLLRAYEWIASIQHVRLRKLLKRFLHIAISLDALPRQMLRRVLRRLRLK